MTISDAAYRTLRNVTLTWKDGSGANDEVTFHGTLEGEPSATPQWTERVATRSRGSLDGYINGEEQEGTLSFAMKLNEVIGSGSLTNFDDMNPAQYLFDPENSVVTGTGAGGEPKQVTVIVKINHPDGTGYETYTLSKCVLDAPSLTMGFPCVIQANMRYRGGYAWAFSATN